ncbi:MAG: MFS transporter [Eubacteriales bacterium]|nr:MFS transporter [Eubacteriales bacterium]
MRNWRHTFIAIWSGQAVSVLTSSVLQIAIVWYITQKTGSAALLSLATLIGFLPQVVLGLFIGVYIDRYKHKTVMILSDAGIALAGMVLVIIGIFGEIPIWLIFVVLFFRSIGAAFHSPALKAVTPTIVPRDQLTRYAGFAHSFESLSLVVSPALAALLFTIWDLNVIVLLDVAGALLAVVVLTFVKIPDRGKGKPSGRLPVLREAKEGFRVLRREPGLWALLVISSLYAFIYFPIGTLYPLITMTWFGGGIAESGTVEVVFSLGMLAGSFLLGVIGGKIKQVNAIILSIGAYGACVLMTGLLPASGLPVFIGLSLIMGMASPFYHGVQTAIYQTRIAHDYLGRVLSLTSSIELIAMPMGLILSGAFADVIGVNRWFAVSGVLTILIFIASARILPKRMDSSAPMASASPVP